MICKKQLETVNLLSNDTLYCSTLLIISLEIFQTGIILIHAHL